MKLVKASRIVGWGVLAIVLLLLLFAAAASVYVSQTGASVYIGTSTLELVIEPGRSRGMPAQQTQSTASFPVLPLLRLCSWGRSPAEVLAVFTVVGLAVRCRLGM